MQQLLEKSDVQLLEGSADDFAVLYDRYRLRAYLVARAVLRDTHRAEDAVQEAYASMWRSRLSYRADRASVATWLLSIVNHRAIDAARRDSKHAGATSIEHAASIADGCDVGASVAERDVASLVRDQLRALPEAQREVIVLAYYGQLTVAEIARAVDAPLGTVKGRMRLGLDKLRDEVEACGLTARLRGATS